MFSWKVNDPSISFSLNLSLTILIGIDDDSTYLYELDANDNTAMNTLY